MIHMLRTIAMQEHMFQGQPMPPFAICLSEKCAYIFDMKEEREGNTKVPPATCPECMAPVIFHCPLCFASIIERPDQREPRCGNCKARLRQDPRRQAKGQSE